jgi:O-antigen ligase
LRARQLSLAPQTIFSLGYLSWLVYHLLSFETLLVLFLFGVRLQALLPRPPLPETVVYGLLSMAVGFWIVWRQGIYVRGIPVFVAGLIFTAWMLLSYGWSPSRVLARESLPFILGVNLWALFAAAFIVAPSRERALRFLILMGVLATLLSVIGAFVYVTHGDFRFYRGPDGSWHHRTYLDWGNTVAVGATVALSLTIYSRLGSLKQLVFIAIFSCCAFFLIIAGARGAMLGPILGGLLAIFINLPRIRDGRIEWPVAQFLAVFILLAVIAYISYLFFSGQGTATLGRFMRLFDQMGDPLLRQGPNRFDYFAGAYQAWLAAPVTGHGLQAFALVFCHREDPGCHPHNVILQSLADFGIIGFILLMIFFGTAIRLLQLSRLSNDPLKTSMLMAAMPIMVSAMVSNNLPNAYGLFFFLGLFALRPPPVDDDDESDDEESLQDTA